MKLLDINLIFYLLLILLFGCSGTQYTVSEFGDKSIIELKNGLSLEGEIVFITDTSLVFSKSLQNVFEHNKIYSLPFSDIKSISIEGFDGSGWGKNVLIFQLLPVGLLAIAAASMDVDIIPGLIVISTIPAGITALLLSESEGETPNWYDSMDIATIKNLSIYSHYPYELNSKELNKLLLENGQKEIYKININ